MKHLLLNSKEEADAFIKWFLRVSIHEIPDEFESEEDRNNFLQKRLKHLEVQVSDLNKLSFNSAIACDQKDQSWFKIIKKVHENTPLSTEGSIEKSSRFNYKNIEDLRSRVSYFGETKDVCFGELFHLDIQKQNYNELAGIKDEFKDAQFPFPDFFIIEYVINVDNILVLTSEPSYKALGIPDRVVKNEWFSINNEFEIPTASQILGAIAKVQGYSGILYASVRSQTKRNLVLFEENTGTLNKHSGIKELNRQILDPSSYF
ncbi:MAG: RES family NAD+ phosphorylase [Bdellovibrionales bacterium]|nr:RES family NAD+ phosphorylase [Bdellovibrionales bacterium]